MNAPWSNIGFDELALKVEERLDEIFGEAVNISEIKEQADSPIGIDHIGDLNKILRSLTPENTDRPITSVLKQLENLKEIYNEDKFILILIRLQNNLCKYIKAHKYNAHPLTFKLLRSIYYTMHDILHTKNRKGNDIIGRVNREIHRYNKLHAIIKKRHYSTRSKMVKRSSKRKTIINELPNAKDQQKTKIHTKESLEIRLFLESVMLEMKDFMRKELEKLRAELLTGYMNR